MKRCPACRRVYDRDARFCQIDGTILADFSSDPSVGQTIAKRYRLIRRLGYGPLGTVYLAVELATGKNVAVKILKDACDDDDVLKQCMWDTRFATASYPAGVVRVYEIDRTDGDQIFIAMEYLDGEPLSALIQRDGALELERALRLARQITQGVAAASRAGVAHRNIKPQNAMVLGPGERIKVTDFGITWLRRAAKGSPARAADGPSKYLAPEQLAGGDADDRSDIYGIGAVLHTLLAGAAPSITPLRVIAGHDARWEAPPPIRSLRPEVPSSVEEFLLRAMAHEPERRHTGMDEFAEALLALTSTTIAQETEHAEAEPEGADELVSASTRTTPRVVIEPVSERAYLALWRACLERWQANQEQWRVRRERWQAQWPAYRARWSAVLRASRAGVSDTTTAAAREAARLSRTTLGASRTIVSAAATATAGAAAAAAGALAGAATSASRTARVTLTSTRRGMTAVSRGGARIATGVTRAMIAAAGAAAAGAERVDAAAARAIAGAARSVSCPTILAVHAVARAVTVAARTVPVTARATGRGLGEVSRATIHAGVVGLSNAGATIIRTIAGVTGGASRAAHVGARVTRRGVQAVARGSARGAAGASRPIMRTAGATAGAATAAARTVHLAARVTGRGLHGLSRTTVRAGAGVASRAVATIGATTGYVATATAHAVSVAASMTGRGLADASRAVVDAVGTTASKAPRVARTARHGAIGMSAVAAGIAARGSHAVTTTARAMAGTATARMSAVPVASLTGARHVARVASLATDTAGTIVRGLAGASRAVVVAVGATASRAPRVARTAHHGVIGMAAVAAGIAARASHAVTTTASALAGAATATMSAVPVASLTGARHVARVASLATDTAGTIVRGTAGAARLASVAFGAASRSLTTAARAMAGAASHATQGATRVVARTAAATAPGVGAAASVAGRAVPAVARAGARGVAQISRPVVSASGAALVRSRAAARHTMALLHGGREEARRWARAHRRALAPTSAAAVVVLGATWVGVEWNRGRTAEVPVVAHTTPAVDSEPAVERTVIEPASQTPASGPARRAESRITRVDEPARTPGAPAMPATDDRKPAQPIAMAQAPERADPRADASTSETRPAPVAARGAAFSTQQVARIQSLAEQKLQRRGLLRVSAVDRWGVTVTAAATGEVTMAGVLRDMTLYAEAVRLVREIPGVREVQGSVQVSDVGAVPIVHSDAARILAEIQQRLRSRGLLRESESDRWGVTVDVNPEGDVTLVGAVRDAEMYSEAVKRAQEVAKVRHVRQDIKVMERDIQQ